MNTIEFFSGTKSFSKVAKQLGYKTFTIDNVKKLKPDLCIDILKLQDCFTLQKIGVMWCSPPCTAFSVASIGKHWDKKTRKPKSDDALLGIQLLEKTLRIISFTKPKYWFIENPRGMMRKVIDELFIKYGITDYVRKTVTYCQYGDNRMKPTDIWTNLSVWESREPCKNGSPCHISAPRGSKTGTQGIKGAKERGVIPSDLFYEIFSFIELDKSQNNLTSSLFVGF